MRLWGRLAVLALGVAAALTLGSPGSADIRPDSRATRTVAALPAGGSVALGEVPADFKQIMGYEPKLATLADGSIRVTNPTGACSVPGEGRPFDFSTACKAHDFGYDLLRYAERKGAPLAPEARDTIDELLMQDLFTQCTADLNSTGCDATVAIFAAGVRFNSWRQVSGPPIDASGLPRTAGLVLLAGLVLPFGLGRVAVTRRRRRTRLVRPAASAG